MMQKKGWAQTDEARNLDPIPEDTPEEAPKSDPHKSNNKRTNGPRSLPAIRDTEAEAHHAPE
eukprot:3080950-Amphidinium_carterae.1